MSALLDALEYAGSVIDKPGRAVRGVLGGRPEEGLAFLPFSDTLGLTDQQNRISGSDLLGQAGLRTGTEWADALLGMGVEAATDPTMLLGLGLGGRAAMAGSRLGQGEDLASAIFKLAPKEEAFAKISPKNLGGLSFGPGDMPLASEVQGMPPWFAEAKLRANAGSRQLGESASNLGPMEFDPAMFPQVPDPVVAPPAPKPLSFEDIAWRVGHPENRHEGSIIGDAMLDGMGRHDLHNLATTQWEHVLGAIAADPNAAQAIAGDPRLRAAMVSRLLDLAPIQHESSRIRGIMPIPQELYPRMEEQARTLNELLGLSTHDYQSLSGRIPADGEFRNILNPDPKGPHWYTIPPWVTEKAQTGNRLHSLLEASNPRDLAAGRFLHKNVADFEHLPLLQPDWNAARAVVGRQDMRATGEALNFIAGRYDAGQESIEEVAKFLNNGTGEILPYALKGAVRTNANSGRDAFEYLMEALQRAGLQGPAI